VDERTISTSNFNSYSNISIHFQIVTTARSSNDNHISLLVCHTTYFTQVHSDDSGCSIDRLQEEQGIIAVPMEGGRYDSTKGQGNDFGGGQDS